MDQKMWDKGLGIRKAVLGEAYVANAMKNVDAFNAPFQDLLNEYCWGSVWGRDELHTGEMWNSNSLISWLIARSGLDVDSVALPTGGRAPGWRAGIVAHREQAIAAPAATAGPG